MTIKPIRDLGTLGVITDVDPFDLPPNAWTMGVNVRFDNKKISRGPVFRTAGLLTNTSPRFVVSFVQLTGAPKFHIANDDGTVTDWASGGLGAASVEADITASGWTPSAFSSPYTATLLDDLIYLNRPDRVPWFRTTGGTAYAPLTNWPSGWLCGAIREFNGQLIALNVTQGANTYPTMIAWSDFTTFGTVPGTWTAGPTNSAGSNVLQDLGDGLVDGLRMRNFFVLYSQKETWLMNATGDNEVFAFSPLFGSDNISTGFGRGVISQNCVVEHDNLHFVFGIDDIWLHDGYTPRSIANSRVRSFIFNNLVRTDAGQFFVSHNPDNTEIRFCYRSIDPYCAFPIGGVNNYQGCNRAAVYNYLGDTWYFYDLPYVTAAGLAPPTPNVTYSGSGAITYSQISGSYASYSDSSLLAFMFVSNNAAALGIGSAVRSFELPGSVAANGLVDTSATALCYLEKTGIDLNEVGAELRGYKVVKSIYPEGRFSSDAQPLIFSFAGADYSNQSFSYGTPMSFDGSTFYKLDYMTSGRYLSVKATFNDFNNFTLSSLDFDLEITGSR